MGGCLSGDVKGGKQAIGGVQQRPTSSTIANNAAHNDAVDFFFRSRGQYPLFSQIEVLKSGVFYVCLAPLVYDVVTFGLVNQVNNL